MHLRVDVPGTQPRDPLGPALNPVVHGPWSLPLFSCRYAIWFLAHVLPRRSEMRSDDGVNKNTVSVRL